MILRLRREHPYFSAFLVSGLALSLYHLLLVFQGGADRLNAPAARLPRLIFMLAWFSVAAVGVAKWLMALEWAPLAVARTVVDEALRMKIAVIFVALLLVALASLPFAVDASSSALRYRLQTMIHYGLTATATLLSLMTLFLACGTLSLEIQDLRIFTTLSKPIGRGQYLLGKWIGLLMLNTALLAVAGCAIHLSVWYGARQKALDPYDQMAVEQEVLTARVSVSPVPPDQEFEESVRERIEKVKTNAPEEYGDTREKQRETERKIWEEVARQWLSVPPQRSRSYIFRDLGAAKRLGEPVQIRYSIIYIGNFEEINRQNQMIRRRFQINGRDVVQEIALGRFQTLLVPPQVIDEKGELRVTFFNSDPLERERNKEITLLFDGKEGLEALYRADSFGPNFWRAVFMLWVKLAFLAILGLMTATFLGFPVACLMSVVILVSAWLSGYLMGEIGRYGIDFESSGAKGLAFLVRGVVRSVAVLLQQYSHFSPTGQVADGRLVSWSEACDCFAWIGLLWCGLTGGLAWLIFRIREVGRVQV